METAPARPYWEPQLGGMQPGWSVEGFWGSNGLGGLEGGQWGTKKNLEVPVIVLAPACDTVSWK